MKTWDDQISKNALAELLGKDRRTIDRKLKGIPFERKGRAYLYDLRTAIEAIYCAFETEDDDDETIDVRLEKAKLDRARRKLAELDLEVKRTNLIPKEILEKNLSSVFGEIKAKILGIPTKAAQRFSGKTQKEVRSILDRLCKETLRDLSAQRLDENIRRDTQQSS